MHFSNPVFDIKYANEDDDENVKSIRIIGYEARNTVTNATLDPITGILKENLYWRGLGDASSENHWLFVGDRFVLKHIKVDVSFDGQIAPQFEKKWP